MKKNGENSLDRREMLKASAMALCGSLLAGEVVEAYPKAVNANSSPFKLKITDLIRWLIQEYLAGSDVRKLSKQAKKR